MIYEYKCRSCMKITLISLLRERKSITCKYCNGEATKNGEPNKLSFWSGKKIPKREKK